MGYLGGFAVTFRQMFQKRVTNAYPDQKRPKADRTPAVIHIGKQRGFRMPSPWLAASHNGRLQARSEVLSPYGIITWSLA